MPKYIDAVKLTDRAYQLNFDKKISERELAIVNRLIAESTTEDVAPVGHSHWIDEYGRFVAVDLDGELTDSCYCNNCKKWLGGSNEYNCFGYYCPNCGAKMDEEEEEGS